MSLLSSLHVVFVRDFGCNILKTLILKVTTEYIILL